MMTYDTHDIPAELFDPAFYARTYPDAPAGPGAGYAHFRAFGMAEGRAPNLWFDPHWYRAQLRRPATGAADFRHFLRFGARAGLCPSPALQLFSWPEGEAAAMLSCCAAIDASLRALAVMLPDPLVQRLAGLFLPAYYKQQAGLPAATPDAAAFGHFVETGLLSGVSCSPLFDDECYRAEAARVGGLPDLASEEAALLHWLQHGQQAKLMPTPVFDPIFYLANNRDLSGSDADALAHFLDHGLYEERSPNAWFAPENIMRTPSVQNLPSLLIYLLQTKPDP